MLFFLITVYLIITGFVMWLLLFPSGRMRTLQIIQACLARFSTISRRWKSKREEVVSGTRIGVRSSLNAGINYASRNYKLLSAMVALLTAPAVIAYLLSGKPMLDSFEDSNRTSDSRIAELLKGEQLVPPPPLPPDMFTTAEVVKVRPMLVYASRNWQLLNAEYAQRLLLVFRIMKERHGYEMVLIEGYRSPERQNMLAGFGSSVTNAAAFQSYHQYGLAGDCAFVRNGKLVISEKDPWAMEGYRLYGEVAGSVGLTWGGNWKMMDFGHTEYRMPGVMKR
ncbi:M15 family metallopeptidase [Herbaspirillum frisingense]|uniref:M15 family metallopeptidase n=1 Tax=Herbaspirillum frisingense TaxID=92645 RepID=UPI001600508A|nr:M15 family metallopeptidase [Herbaspirillum frisingense]QNB09125.1 M15 family metallopeptidase [Herbaspirillum frisingense]